MDGYSDLRRRRLNLCAAAAAFFLLVGLSSSLGLAARWILNPGSEPARGVSSAVWFVSLFAAIAALSAVYRPAPRPEEFFPADEDGAVPPPRRKGRPAFLVPAAVFCLIAVNVLLYFTGLSSGQTSPGPLDGRFVVRAILGCTVYPILEETFFRGLLLSALREEGDPQAWRFFAAALAAFAFASVHTPDGYVFPLVAGFILSVPAPRAGFEGRKTFIPVGCVIAHALYNLSLYVCAALGESGVCDPAAALSAVAGAFAVSAGIMILAGRK